MSADPNGGGGGELGPGFVVGGSYEITRLIGRGGMGSVWEAQHIRLPKSVAVKVLHGDVAADQDAFARFRREAEIASRLGHPNIVEVVDFNTLPSGTPYLVLELLAGESLAERLVRGPVPLATALAIARQIASALAAAHRNDVVHRDLKPDNVFLVPTDSGGVLGESVKVLDFGISKIRNSQTVVTQEAALVGTPQYMSPEQASGKNKFIDQRTDVFALGAIVYEMISGQSAFAGNTLAEVIFKVVFEETPPLEALVPGLPAPVAAAVRRALIKDLAMRTPDMNTFITELTGSPLQTLERRATSQVGVALASTKQRSSEAFSATAAPGSMAQPGALDATVAPALAAVSASISMRGEVMAQPPFVPLAVTAAMAPPPAKRSLGPWLALAVLVVAAPAAYLGYRALHKPPDVQPVVQTTGSSTVAATQPVVPDVPVKPAVVVAQPTPPPAIAGIANPHAVAVTAKPADHGHTLKSTKGEVVPPEITADLDDAEKQLGTNPSETIRLAQRSQRALDTERSHSLVARGYCKKHDLEMAKATLRAGKLSSGERARIKRVCKADGVDID